MIITTIIQAGIDSLKRAGRLPTRVKIAAERILKCRTSHLGGHKQVCPNGDFERTWWNSCRHRFCPQCGFIAIERWLALQKVRLLGCEHFHVVFTMPHDLNPLWQLNTKAMSGIMFEAVHDTLTELLADAKYLGARAGIIAALHTWGQTLALHPHLHCLVTGGGLTKSGDWKAVNNGFLLPSVVVREAYTNRMIRMILKELGAGRLQVPEGQRVDSWQRATVRLGKKSWSVRIMERYSHGEGVATYLARYMRGSPIRSERIVKWDGERVSFAYTDNRATKMQGRKVSGVMKLPTADFVLRLFQHLPEPNLKVVRHWGLYGSRCKEDLNQCRDLLGQGPVEDPPKMDWQDFCERLKGIHPELCPVCGLRLVGGVILPPERSWPLKVSQHAA